MKAATGADAAERVTFQGAGITLAADVAGDEAAPVVIFLHGGGQTRHSWGGAVAEVARSGFRAVSLDLRGHGESGWPDDADYTIDRMVDDLAAVIAAIGRPAVLVGASLGGVTSLLYAGERGTDVTGIVLVDVAPRIEFKGAMRIGAFMRGAPDGFASLDEAADAVAAYLPHRDRPSDSRGLMKNLRRGEDGRLRWHWDPRFVLREFSQEDLARQSERLEAAAVRITVPTLLIRGGLSDVVSPENVAAFRKLMPAAEVVEVGGADHMVAGDRNDRFNGAVIDFLQRHRR